MQKISDSESFCWLQDFELPAGSGPNDALDALEALLQGFVLGYWKGSQKGVTGCLYRGYGVLVGVLWDMEAVNVSRDIAYLSVLQSFQAL